MSYTVDKAKYVLSRVPDEQGLYYDSRPPRSWTLHTQDNPADDYVETQPYSSNRTFVDQSNLVEACNTLNIRHMPLAGAQGETKPFKIPVTEILAHKELFHLGNLLDESRYSGVGGDGVGDAADLAPSSEIHAGDAALEATLSTPAERSI